jgi:uncharacterized membrane-anchored protein
MREAQANGLIAQQHPNRQSLHNEVHARPYEAIESPCTLLHWVYETIGESAADILAHLAQLLKAHHLPAPDADISQISVDMVNYRLRWERHAEFVTYTIWKQNASADELHSALPRAWINSALGRLLSAVEMRVQCVSNPLSANPAVQWVQSSIANASITVSTDFHLQGNGFSVWHVHVNDASAVSPRRLGSITQQLLEIETYRMMGLLGLPAARAVGSQLKQLEQELVAVSGAIDTAEKSQEPALLERLTRLASQVESLFAMHHARFSATSAYMNLVDQRLAGLNEQSMSEYPTLSVFLSRRLTPATHTCISAEKRLQALSERVSRNSNLLRTRVEIEQQEHHKALLSTMTERQLSQLRLQATVEGLSAIAMSYYAAGIVGYFSKALIPYGWPMSVDLTVALSIPLVFFAVVLGMRRVKQTISVHESR